MEWQGEGKTKALEEKNLCQYQFVHTNPAWTGPGLNTGPQSDGPVTNCLSHDMPRNNLVWEKWPDITKEYAALIITITITTTTTTSPPPPSSPSPSPPPPPHHHHHHHHIHSRDSIRTLLPPRHTGWVAVSSTHSYHYHSMGVWSTSHPSHLTPARDQCTHWMGGWVSPSPVWKFRGREKSLAITRIQTPDYPGHSLVIIPTMLRSLPFLEVKNCYSFLSYLLCNKFIFSWYNPNTSLSYMPNYTLIRQILTSTESQFFLNQLFYLWSTWFCTSSTDWH